ncbi:hypothetical protein D3C84_912660 [compost metagenome]
MQNRLKVNFSCLQRLIAEIDTSLSCQVNCFFVRPQELLINPRVIVLLNFQVSIDLDIRSTLWRIVMVEYHDYAAPSTIGNVLPKLSRVCIDNTKSHIGQMPFARAAPVLWQLDLIEVALPLTLKFLVNRMMTVPLNTLATGPLTDTFTGG